MGLRMLILRPLLRRQDNRSRAVAVAIVGLFLSSLVGVVLNMMFYLVQIPTFGWGLDSIWDLLVRMNVAIAATYRFNVRLDCLFGLEGQRSD